MSTRKTLQKVLSGSKNIRLVEGFGFRRARINGSHHIFTHSAIPELVNLQNVRGQAKPYQVRQFMKLVESYDLSLTE